MDFVVEGFGEAFRLLASGDPEVFHALFVSLVCSVVATVGSGVLAVPYGAALGLLRPRTAGAQVFLLRLGLFVPTVVIGLFLYAMLTRRGILGGLGLLHTQAAIAIGQSFLAFPLIAMQVHAATADLDAIVRDEARTLGAGAWTTVRLGLGEVRPSIASATTVAFGRCITELGVALIVGGGIYRTGGDDLLSTTRTMPQVVVMRVSEGEFARALAPGLILVLVGVVAGVAAHLAARRPRP